MDKQFIFAGYQFRVARETKLTCTLADNVNSLYTPNLESLSTEFELIMEDCVVPFLITTEFNFYKLLELSRRDSFGENTLVIFRCAIMKCDLQSAYTDYYDNSGKLITTSFQYVHGLVEPQIEFEECGYDVLDVTIGGGIDSVIHTYGLCTDLLNENGLFSTADAAVTLRNHSRNELPDHGPFTVWSIGLVHRSDNR